MINFNVNTKRIYFSKILKLLKILLIISLIKKYLINPKIFHHLNSKKLPCIYALIHPSNLYLFQKKKIGTRTSLNRDIKCFGQEIVSFPTR